MKAYNVYNFKSINTQNKIQDKHAFNTNIIKKYQHVY